MTCNTDKPLINDYLIQNNLTHFPVKVLSYAGTNKTIFGTLEALSQKV